MLNENQEKWLLFGLGLLWSFSNVPKAYAPTITHYDPKDRKCPDGTRKEYIGCCEALTPQCNACRENARRLGGFECVPTEIGVCPPDKPVRCGMLMYDANIGGGPVGHSSRCYDIPDESHCPV